MFRILVKNTFTNKKFYCIVYTLLAGMLSLKMVHGHFDTKSFQFKSFRYKSKSIRYTCKVDLIQTEVVLIYEKFSINVSFCL